MTVHFMLLFSKQGKVRLSKYYSTFSQKERGKVRVPLYALPAGVAVQRPAARNLRGRRAASEARKARRGSARSSLTPPPL